MKSNLLRIYALGLLTTFSACKKWVDVQPNDRLLEDQVFSDPDNVRAALNGIYSNVAKPEFYGRTMTFTAVDALAQLHSGAQLNVAGSPEATTTGTPAKPYTDYSFRDPALMDAMSKLWSQAYRTVLNINLFLTNLDKYPGVISQQEEKLYRGEVYALRAMIHFDLLRLFGPVYVTDSAAVSIPYYTKAQPEVMARIPAIQVMDSVMRDLSQALELLAGDPILTEGKMDRTGNDGLDYSRMRNLKMNYYAVKALEARMLLYRNNKAAAYAAATALIPVLEKEFPWFDPVKGRSPVDRCFSSEVIFALNIPNLYDWSRDLFSGATRREAMFTPNNARLNSTYENNLLTDYRFASSLNYSWWEVPGGGDIAFKTMRKYNNPDGDQVQFRYRMPLLRKSELYYIAAETAPNDTEGFDWLNQVRSHRGLTAAPNTTVLATEIQKEYAKEFYGEGQLFFYYKRTNTGRILKGSTTGTTSSNYQAMTPAQYVMPVPDAEIIYQ